MADVAELLCEFVSDFEVPDGDVEANEDPDDVAVVPVEYATKLP